MAIIGIDLGTTNSVVAVMEGGEPKVLTNAEGARTTPSVVAINTSGEFLVGQVARRQAITNPTSTVSSVKRFMGRSLKDVEGELRRVSYEVVEAENGDAVVRLQGRRYSPPEVSARILMKLKREAEQYLGETVTEAVITVPAYFNDAQRQATRDAGRIAGLEVRRLVNEPTAAALAYNLDGSVQNRLVAVYDFGGGTFDISILEMGDGVVEVVATAGDTHLGGDDIDQKIIDFLLEQFKAESGMDISQDKMVLQRLKEAAEKAKIELSSTVETDVNLPFLTADASGPKHLNVRLSRAKLEYLMDEFIERTVVCCRKALADASLQPNKIGEVILVGGSTRIPAVQRRVEEMFGQTPRCRLNPDEVVAMGAALQGGIIGGDVKDLLLLDVTSLSLGVETRGGLMTRLIERNTTIPVKRSRSFTTAVDNQRQVEIHILQGEREFSKDNHSLGRFILDNIPPATRGTPKIEVTFDIDANGMVHVSAVEKTSGRKQEVTVEPSGGLSEGDIQRMVHEAEGAEGSDRERRKLVEARNRLDGVVIAALRGMRDEPEGPAELRQTLDLAVDRAQAALRQEGTPPDEVQGSYEALAQALAAYLDAARKAREAQEAPKPSEEGGEPTREGAEEM